MSQLARIILICLGWCAIQRVPVDFIVFTQFFNIVPNSMSSRSLLGLFVKIIKFSKHFINFVKKVPLKVSLIESSRRWFKQSTNFNQGEFSFTLTLSPLYIPLLARDMVKHELRVESLKARVEIQKYEFESTSYEFESTSYEFESTSYEFESTSYEFKSTSYEFKSTSYEFKSTSSRIIKSMKTQVNSLKSSSFP